MPNGDEGIVDTRPLDHFDAHRDRICSTRVSPAINHVHTHARRAECQIRLDCRHTTWECGASSPAVYSLSVLIIAPAAFECTSMSRESAFENLRVKGNDIISPWRINESPLSVFVSHLV